jgi:osmoprotectant transport system ATP-binding protein
MSDESGRTPQAPETHDSQLMTRDAQLATPPVRFQDVGFLHAGRPEVLGRLNLSVESGEMIAVVGRSGAGKTTLLKLVNRLLLPTSGAVIIEGRDTRDWDGIRLRRRIGYVFQDVGLFPHMTIEENIEVVPRLEQWPPERARGRAHQLLDLVGLPPRTYASRRPDELSGGQRQRVGLARALAIDPPIILMDEPFGALDPVTRTEVRREFARIQEQLRTTVIIVTHDMAEAFILGRRIGVLDAGQLVICDTPTQVAVSPDPRVRAFIDTLPCLPAAEQTKWPM